MDADFLARTRFVAVVRDLAATRFAAARFFAGLSDILLHVHVPTWCSSITLLNGSRTNT